MKRLGKLMALIFIMVSGSHAMTATITINVSGIITSYDPAISSIEAGDLWRAELTIDSGTPNNSPNNNESQGYYYGLTGDIYIGNSLISHIDGSGGNQYPNPVVLVENDHQSSWKEDEIAIFGYCCTSSPVENYSVRRFFIYLRDSNFFETEIPHSNPFNSHNLSEILSVDSLNSFQDSKSDLLLFGMDFVGEGGESTILGSVASYNASISEVPIPVSLFLFGSGVLSLAGINFKNRKRKYQ